MPKNLKDLELISESADEVIEKLERVDTLLKNIAGSWRSIVDMQGDLAETEDASTRLCETLNTAATIGENIPNQIELHEAAEEAENLTQRLRDTGAAWSRLPRPADVEEVSIGSR